MGNRLASSRPVLTTIRNPSSSFSWAASFWILMTISPIRASCSASRWATLLNMLLGNNQDMHRGCRVNIAKSNDPLILKYYLRRILPGGYPAEQAILAHYATSFPQQRLDPNLDKYAPNPFRISRLTMNCYSRAHQAIRLSSELHPHVVCRKALADATLYLFH